MDSKILKNLFFEEAKVNGFEKAFGGLFKGTEDCIVVLDLQKSNYGNYYELNIKIFVQGIFGETYVRNKSMVKRDTGDIFTRQPDEYRDVLNCDLSIDETIRSQKLKQFFAEFLVPFTDKISTRKGILDVARRGEIALLPAVKEQLERL